MEYNKNKKDGVRLPVFKMKKFVSATTPCAVNSPNINAETIRNTSGESGDSISTFYTNICGDRDNNRYNDESSDSDDVNICDVITNKNKPKNKFSSFGDEKMLNKAMKHAQEDDRESLKAIIEKGLSVNASDIYGWSLLMVASFAGSKNVVKYLLSKGARRGKRDSKGNTALYLASKNYHTNIVNLLIKKGKFENPEENKVKDTTTEEINGNTSAYCEICNLKPSCTMRQHEASISHIFKLGKYPARTLYGIPRHNIGFQMLLQQGWNDSEGLGPEGTGRKYPIKSIKKKDRCGVGHKVKITKDEESQNLCRNMKVLCKKKTTKQLEKLKEKKFRQMFNEPDIKDCL